MVPRILSRLFLIFVLVILAAGCSGKSDPLSSSFKHASLIGNTPSHPVLSKVIDITFDDQTALGWGYFYDDVKPGTQHSFKAEFADNLSWFWSTDDAIFINTKDGTGKYSEIIFEAPSFETEISIYLDLTNQAGETANLRWRINVAEDPVPLEFIHPNYEDVMSMPDSVTGDTAEMVANEFLVTFHEDVPLDRVLRTVFNMECTVLTKIYDSGIYRVFSLNHDNPTVEVMERFADLDYVIDSEPNFIFHTCITPNDQMWSNKWDLRLMNSEPAWDVTIGNSEHYIAIIDTGIDLDHPDLIAKVVDGQDFITGGDGRGGETPGEDADARNPGHGTHCAGISAAASNNSIGTTGVSWNTKLIPLRIFPADGYSGAPASATTGAYNWLLNNTGTGPGQYNIIAANMSYGGSGGFSTQTQALMNQLYDKGIVMIAAAGNSNSNANNFYPCAYDKVMSVAATNSSDVRASFSNYGTTVDVSAPGVNIRSTYYRGVAPHSTYADLSGTSMAAPQVTGAVGLVKARWPHYSVSEIVDQIKFTTHNIDAQNPTYVGRLGTGRIDLHKMVTQGLTPELEFASIQINEDKFGKTDGNRDLRINSGELVDLFLTISNTGLTNANEVAVTVEVDNPMVHLIKDNALLASATRGEKTTFADPFRFKVERALPNQTDVTFTFTLNDNDENGPWVMNKTVKIYKNLKVQDTVYVTAEVMGPSFVARGQEDSSILRFDFTTDSNYAIVKDITLRLIGSVDHTDIDAVRLYLDTRGDQNYYGSDVELEIGKSSYYNSSFFGDFDRLGNDQFKPFQLPIDQHFGVRRFDSSRIMTFKDIMLAVSNDKTTSIFLVIDISPIPCPGETLGIGIASANDIVLMDNDLVSGSFPLGADLREIAPVWGDELRLTWGTGRYIWRARTAVDNLGYLHVVWDENKGTSNDFDIGYLRSTDSGETWDDQRKLEDQAPHRSFFPDIVATDNGTLHVIFYETPDGNPNRQLYYMRSFDNGVSWEAKRQIVPGANESRIARMYAEGNKIHVAFHSNRVGSQYNIYYCYTDDNGDTFSQPVQVNNTTRESENASIVAFGDEVHITWQDVTKTYGQITSGRAMYAYSTDGGETFSSAVRVSDAVGGTYCYACKIDADIDTGMVYLVFHSEIAGSFDIYMANGTGGDLSNVERVTFWDESGTGNPEIIVDGDGRINLFYDDTVSDVTNIWHQFSIDGGSTWSTPAQVSFNPSGHSQIPAVSKDMVENNIYCFWQDNRFDVGEGYYERIRFNRLIYACD